ncbi:MAG TPA: sigma-70 family RNA polymerase sigma factor [Candidatus Omnitrophota bacterium]|nr:sigma-70 family RNA polymerase sigma factor [Candidatus Omnitrophota bacterium]HPS36339.1 sigma-70 family RNA polymerase sigma factor [Candidatus Omnitrophota bacterium]
MEKSDEELMRAYQEGEEEAMGEIFRRYQKKIFNFALRFLGGRADAEDATADVFLSLLKKSAYSFRDAKFSTWLYTVARNACLSKLRAVRNIFSLSFSRGAGENEMEWDIPDPATAGNELHQKEIGHHIRNAVKNLPVPQKEVLILREYHDLSYDEIARITGQSLSNVKVLIFRAREQLRKSLGFLFKEVQS